MDIDLSLVQQKMIKAKEIIAVDLSSIRSGRATPSLVENITVIAYNGTQKLKIRELGTISAQDTRTLVIIPWDQSVLDDICKGILEANVGVTPVKEGNLVRISIPLLTEERRKEYVKLLKQKIEAGRIMVRQLRHDKMSEIKRNFEEKIATEDEKFKAEENLQKLTDKVILEIELLGKEKEEELLQI